jgi:hypothetical protein
VTISSETIWFNEIIKGVMFNDKVSGRKIPNLKYSVRARNVQIGTQILKEVTA